MLVRRGDGKARGHQASRSLGGIWGFWSAKLGWQQKVPSQPLGQDGHISASLVFKCGGSFQPPSEGTLGRSFSCSVQGTSKWAVKYFWSWTLEILPGPVISIRCSGTCRLSQPYFPPYLHSVPWGFRVAFTGMWNEWADFCDPSLGELAMRGMLRAGKPRHALGCVGDVSTHNRWEKNWGWRCFIFGRKGKGRTGSSGETQLFRCVKRCRCFAPSGR